MLVQRSDMYTWVNNCYKHAVCLGRYVGICFFCNQWSCLPSASHRSSRFQYLRQATSLLGLGWIGWYMKGNYTGFFRTLLSPNSAPSGVLFGFPFQTLLPGALLGAQVIDAHVVLHNGSTTKYGTFKAISAIFQHISRLIAYNPWLDFLNSAPGALFGAHVYGSYGIKRNTALGSNVRKTPVLIF